MRTSPDNPERKTVQSWLDNLQQESWQLELLISGFAIFLLFGGWGPVRDLEYDLILAQDTSSRPSALNMLYYVTRTAYYTLTVCLVIHVVLRGLWIAAVGLRSVSGDIEYDTLRFKPRFIQKLRRSIGSFDEYILRLERNCSVSFSVAFLIIFCFLSLATWSIFAVLVQEFSLWVTGGQWQGNGVFGGAGIASLVVLIMGAIYLLDFISLGLLKRVRWLSTPYYYLYTFMGWVTLARFYRPLYYNLIDNRFGRRLAIALPVVVFLILVVVSLKQMSYSFYPVLPGDGKVWVDHNNYDDEEPNPFDQYWRASLASKYATNNYVELFIPYRPKQHDPIIKALAPELEVSQYTGTKLRGAFTVGERYNPNADYPAMLETFQKIWQITLNDSLVTVTPRFHDHPAREQPGVLYMIPVHDLPTGEHQLTIRTLFFNDEGETDFSKGRTIYFYK